MKKTGIYFFIVIALLLSVVYRVDPAPLDWLKSVMKAPASNTTSTADAVAPSATVVSGITSKLTSTKLSDTQIGSGLKEALKVGIENTIKLLGKQDGYLGNEAVKVLLPSGLKNMEPTLRRLGLGPKIDEFVLSMNRAAEKAAPLAADIFSSAITGISFDDAQKILKGGPTAATEHLKGATYTQLLDIFKPAVTRAMNEYDVTKKYEELMGQVKGVPMLNSLTGKLDLGGYVSGKALDGLFKVLGEQEADIRANPAARVTDLLKQVFNK